MHSAFYWPDGFVSDLFVCVKKYLQKLISIADVYMIFDRYYEKSIKSLHKA